MKKSIIGLSLVFVLFLSFKGVAQASWYNPLSWFKHATTGQIEPSASQLEVNSVPATDTTISLPKCADNSSTVHSLEDKVSVLSGQVTGLLKKVNRLNTVNQALATDNATQKTEIQLYSSQLANLKAVPIVVPKTKDQLAAEYIVAHPKPVCDTSKMDSIQAVSYCTNLYTTWAGQVNTWVNQQLSSQ